MRKGDMSLEFIVSLIILTIVALTIIGIFTNIMQPPEFQCQAGAQKIDSACQSKCNSANRAQSQESRREAIFEYCSNNFDNVCPSDVDLVSNIYVRGSGFNSFCRDKAFCFNFPKTDCTVDGETLNPQNCLESMCKTLTSKGLSTSKAEDRIKQVMDPGDCNLKSEASEEILVDTWWEKYYQNPDCEDYGTSDGTDNGGSDEGPCSDFSCSADYSIQNPGCMTEGECENQGLMLDDYNFHDTSFCSSGKGCCCVK